jgi:RimJ/RimL family protein N-acetyltransferase
MGNQDNGVGLDKFVLSHECDEPGGKVVRTVRVGDYSFKTLKLLWENLSQFETLFNDHFEKDFSRFVSAFVRQENGEPVPTGLMWLVDDIGMLRLTDMVPLESASAHFIFWDRRFRGREELIRKMLEHVFEKYKFHRIKVEVPLYAQKTLVAVERIGFTKEGRMREAVRYKGEWFDANLYSMLEGDLK